MPKAVVYVCNHSPRKAKAGRSLGIAAQPIEFNGWVPGSRETLSLKTRWLRNDIPVDLCPLKCWNQSTRVTRHVRRAKTSCSMFKLSRWKILHQPSSLKINLRIISASIFPASFTAILHFIKLQKKYLLGQREFNTWRIALAELYFNDTLSFYEMLL